MMNILAPEKWKETMFVKGNEDHFKYIIIYSKNWIFQPSYSPSQDDNKRDIRDMQDDSKMQISSKARALRS